MEKTTIYELLGFLLAFLGIGIAYFAIHFGLRQEKLKREFEHKERMMALEMGRSLPGDTPWLSPLRVGFLIATVVPIGVFGFTYLASRDTSVPADIWQGAGIVSVFALIGGSVVACIASAKQSSNQTHAAGPVEKTPVEEDAYDVVSSRA